MAADFPLKITIGAVDRLTAPVAAVQTRLNRIFAPLKVLSTKLGALGQTAGVTAVAHGFRDAWHEARNFGGELTRAGIKLAGLGAAAGAALKLTVFDFSKAGDSAAKASQRLGVGVEWLQEWRFAAERANIEQEALDAGIERFSRGLGEAAFGKGEALFGLRALRIGLRDSNGELRSTEDLLPEVADKLSALRDETVRNALAQKLFGRGGVAMVQLLQEGSRGIEELRLEARRLGIVIGTEDAAAAEEFEDRLTDLKSATRGLRFAIGRELLPVVSELSARFKDWLVDRLPAVRAWAQGFARELPERLRALRERFDELKARLQPIIGLGKLLVRTLGPLKTVGLGLAVVVGGPLLTAVAGLAAAFASLGGAMLTTPFGLFMLGGIALAGVATFVLARWGPVGGFFKKLLEQTGARFDELGDKAEKAKEKLAAPDEEKRARWDLWSKALALGAEMTVGKLRRPVEPLHTVSKQTLVPFFRSTAESVHGASVENQSKLEAFFPFARIGRIRNLFGGLGQEAGKGTMDPQQRATLRVEFANMPKGARVYGPEQYESWLDLQTKMGWSMVTP